MIEQASLAGSFTLPGTSLTVKRMGYGAMQLAGPQVFGPPRDTDEAVAVLREAVESGVEEEERHERREHAERGEHQPEIRPVAGGRDAPGRRDDRPEHARDQKRVEEHGFRRVALEPAL